MLRWIESRRSRRSAQVTLLRLFSALIILALVLVPGGLAGLSYLLTRHPGEQGTFGSMACVPAWWKYAAEGDAHLCDLIATRSGR
jgi:hypothetical protein